MKNQYPYAALIGSMLLLMIVTLLIYPYYQYYVDPDAVAYLTVSKRYASGDVTTAINGYWSPWSCWLTALFIRQGMEAFKAAIVVNTIGAAGFLLSSVLLFARFIKDRLVVTALAATLALFLAYAVYKQSFADLWYMFFLMIALLLLLHRNFLTVPRLWVMAGVFGALAYYAKAYAFPYFILAVPVLVAVLIKRSAPTFSYKKWLLVSGVAILTMVVFSLPWIWMLHEKYGKWMTSTAGSLNLSWYLIGHPYFKEGIDLLIPPVYTDAVYYWEDPYLVNGATPHFWNSPKLFLMQLVRMGYTVLKLVNSMNELSAFFLLMSVCSITIVCSKKVRALFHPDIYLLSIIMILFPLGYLLINFESRYLWHLLPLGMILGIALIDKVKLLLPSGKMRAALIAVFCMSFLVFPVWDMKALFRVGEKEYHLAQELRRQNIRGSFASNISELVALQAVIRVAYFSGNSFYYMPRTPENNGELLKELRRYPIGYYFHFQEPFDAGNIHCGDGKGNVLPLVFKDSILSGLKVYRLRP